MKTLKKLVSCLLVFSMIASMFLTVAAVENSTNVGANIGDERTGVKFDSVTTQGVTHQDGFYKSEEKLNALPLTYEAWVQVVYADGSFEAGGPLVGNRENGDPYWFSFELIAWGQVSLEYGYEGGTKTYTFPLEEGEKYADDNAVRVWDDGWHHLTVVHDVEADEVRCYLDGVLASTISGEGFAPDAKTADNPFYLGNNAEGANFAFGLTGAFAGSLGDTALYSDVRTADEIKSDFDNGFDTSDANLLVAYGVSADDKGKDIADISANGNDLKWRLPTVIDRTVESYSTLKGLDTLPQTYEMWVYVPLAAKGQYSNILFSNITNGDGIRIDFKENKTAEIRLVYIDGGAWKESVLWEAGLTTDVWAHVAIVHDTTKGEISVYANGVHKATKAFAAPSDSVLANKNFYFPGNGSSAAGQTVPRVLGDMAAYSDVRTAEEIVASYKNGPDVTDENLMFYWDVLGAGKGEEIKDQSKNGRHLKYNSLYSIDRTKEQLATDKKLEAIPQTYEMWAYLPAASNKAGGNILFANVSAANGNGIRIDFKENTSGELRLSFLNEWAQAVSWGTGATVPVDTWTHVTITHDIAAGAIKFYFNGVLAAERTIAITPTVEKHLANGAFYYGGDGRDPATQTVLRMLGDFATYTDVRTADEIMSDYLNGPDLNDSNILFYWDVPAAGTKQDIKDKTGNGYDLKYTTDLYCDVTTAVSSAEAGTVTGAGTYVNSNTITATATVNEGYKFVGWYENGALVSSNATYTFIVTADRNLVAEFVKECEVKVNVAPAEGGTVSGAGVYDQGANVTVTATANEGYKFLGWFVGEELKSADAAYTFTAEANIELTAKFEKITYSVATDANGNILDPYFINGDIWVEDENGIKMPADRLFSFLLFDTPLATNRIEATFENITFSGSGDDRNGIVFALTNHDGDTMLNDEGDAGVSYYWAFISGWEGRICVLKMGKYNNWGLLSAGGDWSKCGTPLAELGIDPADGVTLAVEWDNAGHIKVFANGILVEDITDTTGTPLTGNLYGTLVRRWANRPESENPETYTDIVTSFVAGGALATADKEVSVTVDPVEGGTVTGAGDYYLGQNVTLTATPNAGYKFVGWYVGEDLVSKKATYEFIASASVALTAKFEKEVYTITVTPAENGTATGGGTFAEGAEVTVTATPNTGYKFVGWYVGEELKSADAAYTFTAEANIELTAKFEKITYSVATDANGNILDPYFVNGVIWVEDGNGSIKMPANNTFSFLLFNDELATNRIEATIWPNDLHGSGDDRNGIVFALTDVDKDATLGMDNDVSYYWAYISGWEGRIQVLKIEGTTWDVISTGSWGGGTPLADLGIDLTDGVTLAVEWDNEGHIKVFADGKLVDDITDSNPLQGDLYGMLVRKWGNSGEPGAENYPYDAPVTSFIAGGALETPKQVGVTVDPVEGGTVTGAGNYYVGQIVTLTATANEGYKFLGWYNGDYFLTADVTYTLTIAEDITLTAKFEKNAYTVGATAGEGGTVAGAGSYDEGASVTVTAAANEGYRFVGWFVGEELKSADAEYTFTASENVELTAKFIKVHSILVAAGEGGTVSGDGSYDDDATVTLTVTTAEGYKFLGWFDENGELVSAEETMTFTITEDRYFTAVFEELPHFVTNTYEENVIDYTAVGNTITVDHDVPCSVGYLDGDKYVALTATLNNDGTYSYVVPDDVTEIVLVVKGDANGDGTVNAGDYGWLNSALLGDDALSAKEQFVADINGDGQINAGDYARLNAILLGKVDFAW